MRQPPRIEDSVFNAGSSKQETPISTKVKKRRRKCEAITKRDPPDGSVDFLSIFLLFWTLFVILFVSLHPPPPSVACAILGTWTAVAVAVVKLWKSRYPRR
jgi:hypothetical protein